ncbi:hypothetical protein [Nocardioides sp. MH1]|uniref:hypothetical protein n=1 Tax=Nocardioides sp. MH1 TaxID=3242490 RepID=UPI003521B7EC
MSVQNPVSPKAIASTAGAGLGAALTTLLTWVLGVVFWDADSSADKAGDAIAAVPTPVSGIVILVIPVALAAVAGWKVTDPHRVTTDELHQLRASNAAE